MKSMKFGMMAAFAAALSCGAVQAENWMPAGAKGVGMGGAGVACPEGSQAMLSNPAALGKKDQNRFDIALPISIMASAEGDLVEIADTLRKNYDTNVGPSLTKLRSSTTTPADYVTSMATVVKFLTVDAAVLNKPGQGIGASVDGHLTTRVKRFGLAAGTRVLGGGTVVYDSNFSSSFVDVNGNSLISNQAKNLPTTTAATASSTANASTTTIAAAAGIGLSADQIRSAVVAVENANGNKPLNADQTTLLTSIVKSVNATPAAGNTTGSTSAVNNNTGIKIKLLQTREISAAYAFSFMEDKLIVAPAIKIIKGETSSSYIRLLDSASKNTNIGDQLTDSKNAKSSTAITLDLGLLYAVNARWNIGLMGKDLSSPSFETSIGEDIKLERNVRLGTAYEYSQKPGWRGILAADVDALKNTSSIVKGAERQELSLGLSQDLMGWLSLRAGLGNNFGGTNDSTSYSAGLGIQLFRLFLDVSAMKSNDDVTVDGNDFPTSGGFGITLGWNQNF